MPTPKLLLPITLIALLMGAPAQAQILIGHVFPGVCDGFIIFTDPPFPENPVWIPSDGVTQVNVGYVTFENPGAYELWEDVDGEMVFVDEYTIESNGWKLDCELKYMMGQLSLSGAMGIKYCGGISAFNKPCCDPDPAQTQFMIYQDGQPMDLNHLICAIGCTPTCLPNEQFAWLGLDYGHVYQAVVNDPVCAGLVLSTDTLVAYSCANLEVITEVVAATIGQADGAITLVEAIPDPNEPYPIEAPVTGRAMLLSLADPDNPALVGLYENVGTATWAGLEEGYYILSFLPDQICQEYVDTIFVGSSVGMDDPMGDLGMRIYPTLVEEAFLFLASDPAPAILDIWDAMGRVVMHTEVNPGMVPVEHLPGGTYIVAVHQHDKLMRTRIIKQ